ncbi:MAG: hypothetical protein PVG14_15335 [Anaerolineales bacterium]
MLYLYLEDTDAAYQRALEAGATSLQEPQDQFYGDRTGGGLGATRLSAHKVSRREVRFETFPATR